MDSETEPDIVGFDSDGDAVPATPRGRVRTRRFYADGGEEFVPAALPPATRQRQPFRARSNTDPLAPVPEDAVLDSQPSLDWDTFGQEVGGDGGGDGGRGLNDTRRLSTDTLFSFAVGRLSAAEDSSVLADSEHSDSERLDSERSDSESSEGEDYLSPENAASGDEPDTAEEEMADGGAAAGAAAGAEAMAAARRRVERALMEANEDVLPFQGRPVTLECLNKLTSMATSLKKDLQRAHLDLMDDDIYRNGKMDAAEECRARLTAFLVEAEASRVEKELQEREYRANVAATAAAAAANGAEAKRPIAARRLAAARDELTALTAALKRLTISSPTSDAEVFEKAEKLKCLEQQQLTALQDSKEALNLATECNLVAESGQLEVTVADAKKGLQTAKDRLVDWRKEAGVWSEKKQRGAARQDLKMPSFSPSMAARMTIYEFEKEWIDYKAAMEYSKEEALKYLRQAIQQPTRGDIISMKSEKDVFDYLKKHYGNPMVLLNAREEEIRSWSMCSGTELQQREWLIQAKSKLEATVKMCQEHGIEKYLHFSNVAGEIQAKLDKEMVKDLRKELRKHMGDNGVLDKEKLLGLMIEFMNERIMDCTLGVNLDITNFLSSRPPEGKAEGGNPRGQRQRSHAANVQGSGGGQRGGKQADGNNGKKTSFEVDDKCVSCQQNHSHMFYCEAFIGASVDDRFALVRKQQACARCLGMKVKLTGRRENWFPQHERYCKTKFACQAGSCNGRSKSAQFHITVCKHHAADNKTNEADFIASLDQNKLPVGFTPSNISFLYMLPRAATMHAAAGPPPGAVGRRAAAGGGYSVLPDIDDAAVFMLQWLPCKKDSKQQLLVFYDSGCSGAGISDRAVKLLDTRTVREGPTVLDVAGGRSLELPHGDEQFNLPLEGGQHLATITALHMPEITTPFPLVRLAEAWQELQTEARRCSRTWELPTADDTVGGAPVDVLIGIKYLKYHPILVFSLPSGLSIYRARFQSASGRQAVLGGPHSAWTRAAEQAGHMSPRAYFTAETRAWYMQEAWVRQNQDLFPVADGDNVQNGWDAAMSYKMRTCRQDEKEFWHVEAAGTEAPYRCVECRLCQKCKRGDELEEISFKEEAEQALIENSVELDVDKRELRASLPFIEDPASKLKPNRFIAEQVLKSQMRLFEKKPDMRDDAVKSHAKLVTRGHVKAEKQLTEEERAALLVLPGDGYFIPWRIVHNEGSLSTPCRIVFDASSKTPGGDSLNGVLAKGRNRLVKLQHLLARFRQGPAAVSADISMAYNGTKLKAEYLKYQKYLWKEGLDDKEPPEVMYVLTLIYGVKPSGAQCQVSIEKLADHFAVRGECATGADILKKDVYVDDVMASMDSVESCYRAATDIEKILSLGSMAVKAFTFSGQPPSPEVSADGRHVGLGGYLWRPEADQLVLDIGPPRLGKAKRGKEPPPVTGDFGSALKKCFTRRIVSGLVARVFDPLGLATPVTGRLKLDLHALCGLKLDWDDPIPVELLEVWAKNMKAIQDLKEIYFQRSVIPSNAANTKISLLVAVDASQYLGVAAIYGRVELKGGGYSCQLMLARSKIMADLTIPRAELKSAVMGATSANVLINNLGDQLGDIMYVTDSTICLHWVNQDDRPLQVAIRNSVIEIRRLSEKEQWFHVESDLNIADLGTRGADPVEIGPGSAWQSGKEWMRLPRHQMPVKTAAEIVLSAEEKRAAAVELRSRDIRGHTFNVLVDRVADRYACSQYVLDPCRFSWTKSVRIVAFVLRFIKKLKEKATSVHTKPVNGGGPAGGGEALPNCPTALGLTTHVGAAVVLRPDEVTAAEEYFYRKATEEVKKFAKKKDYEHISQEKNGILYFVGRLLDSTDVTAMEKVMFDLNPTSFCTPIVDRYSPVAYSVMVETHWSVAHHLNATCTFRESLSKVYVLSGRDLALEVRNTCVFCRRFKAKMQQVEMGQTHQSRLTIAPAFTLCQVDLLGPYAAQCEHNHRATVKVWGVVFKCPASGAVFVCAMSKYDTSAFLQAYTRFATRYCHPQRLYPDEGSQLIRACKEMEVSWVDVAHTLNAEHGVGVEFQACPVGGHNFHGMVERSVKEIKKLFDTVYKGVKLDLLGFETAFSWLSNELNNMPLCLGNKYRDLDHLDLLTPNRLIHGRSNRRALSGCCMVDRPSVMLERMNEVFEAWWKAWHEEKLVDFVASPIKRGKSERNLQLNDIVIFQKTGEEQVLGEPIWRIGRIVGVEESKKDGLVRAVTIQYKNKNENVFRETRRAARKVAVLHREDELEMVQELNAAAREAEKLMMGSSIYFSQQEAVFRDVQKCQDCTAPFLCGKHNQYFMEKPFVERIHTELRPDSETAECNAVFCAQFGIHTDPW